MRNTKGTSTEKIPNSALAMLHSWRRHPHTTAAPQTLPLEQIGHMCSSAPTARRAHTHAIKSAPLVFVVLCLPHHLWAKGQNNRWAVYGYSAKNKIHSSAKSFVAKFGARSSSDITHQTSSYSYCMLPGSTRGNSKLVQFFVL